MKQKDKGMDTPLVSRGGRGRDRKGGGRRETAGYMQVLTLL